MSVIAPLVLAAALAGALLRPRDLHESVFAAAGGALMVAIGAEPASAALDVVSRDRNVFAFLAGVLMLAALADASGLFRLAARATLRAAGRSQAALFWAVSATAFAGTVLLSLDATAVALTPVVLVTASATGASAEPLLLACIAVANTASVALPVSNPTNLIVTSRLGLDFGAYARVMFPAALVASLAVTAVLRLRYRHELRRPLRAPRLPESPSDRRFALLAALAAAAALVGFWVLPAHLGWVALAAGGAGTLAALAARRIGLRDAAAATGPRLLIFALGTFVMVDAVQRHGLQRLLAEHGPSSSGGIAATAAGLANLVNNLPATLLALPLAHGHSDRAYALLVGTDIGPDLTLTGSLATLLWLTLARQRDAEVSARRYLSVGVLTAPVGVICALAVVWALR